jgi:hypothetical protein
MLTLEALNYTNLSSNAMRVAMSVDMMIAEELTSSSTV